MRTASIAQLAEFSTAILMSAGADAAPAEAATWALLHASAHGVDSHGVRLIPWYVECLKSGLVKGSSTIAVSHPRRAAALVDAGGGMGHIAMYRAMDEACAIARDCGIGMASVISSSHFGAAGAYTIAAADAGFIGFAAANSGALVVPHGGTEAIHGTNPLSFCAPNPGGDPFLLDMATSSIPWNRVLRYRKEALELPEEVAVGGNGHFVTDPNLAVALAPLGGKDCGFKGAGLAGMAEVLSAVLTGMRLSTGRDRSEIADINIGHFVMAIDPTLFMTLEAFGMRLQTYLDGFARQPGTYAAGGPEWQRRRQREVDGIPLPDSLCAELEAAAKQAGVSFSL